MGIEKLIEKDASKYGSMTKQELIEQLALITTDEYLSVCASHSFGDDVLSRKIISESVKSEVRAITPVVDELDKRVGTGYGLEVLRAVYGSIHHECEKDLSYMGNTGETSTKECVYCNSEIIYEPTTRLIDAAVKLMRELNTLDCLGNDDIAARMRDAEITKYRGVVAPLKADSLHPFGQRAGPGKGELVLAH